MRRRRLCRRRLRRLLPRLQSPSPPPASPPRQLLLGSGRSRKCMRLDARAGVLAALVSAVLFGATTSFAKQLLSGTQPLLIAGLLYLGSGVGVSAMRWVQDRGWSPTGLV